MRIILKIILFGAIFTIALAKDVPLSQYQEIKIPTRTTTIIEMPFSINAKPRISAFKRVAKRKVIDRAINAKPIVPTIATVPTLNRKNSKNEKRSKKPKIIFNTNIIELTTYSKGEFEIILWGHSKYPVVLKIVIDDEMDKTTNRYLSFKDMDKKEDAALISSPHLIAISKMIKPLYYATDRVHEVGNNICLDGHSMHIPDWKFATKHYKAKVIFECRGSRYTASKWILTNKRIRPISIKTLEDYKELRSYVKKFFRNKASVYSLFIDTPNRFLKQNESVELYVVSNKHGLM